MKKFTDSISNNTLRLNILDENGLVVDTHRIQITGLGENGTSLNAETFNQMLDEISSSCSIVKNVTKFKNVSEGPEGSEQIFSVPETGIYHIKAAGAKGGKGAGADEYSLTGGKGAIVEADFHLNKGDELVVVVGQKGGNSSELMATEGDFTGGGGGGGTFVFRKIRSADSSIPYQFRKKSKDGYEESYEVLLVASGGGGSSDAASGTILSGSDGNADSIKSPSNYLAPGQAIFGEDDNESISTGGSIKQYIKYDARGNTITRNETTVSGGYGCGAAADDSVCTGGGWSFGGSSTAYSWSLGENSIGITGGNEEDHGYCTIEQPVQIPIRVSLTVDGMTLNIKTEERK